MAKGRYDKWSNVSVTLEDDSRRIMGAEMTMSEKRSDDIETTTNIVTNGKDSDTGVHLKSGTKS